VRRRRRRRRVLLRNKKRSYSSLVSRFMNVDTPFNG